MAAAMEPDEQPSGGASESPMAARMESLSRKQSEKNLADANIETTADVKKAGGRVMGELSAELL